MRWPDKNSAFIENFTTDCRVRAELVVNGEGRGGVVFM